MLLETGGGARNCCPDKRVSVAVLESKCTRNFRASIPTNGRSLTCPIYQFLDLPESSDYSCDLLPPGFLNRLLIGMQVEVVSGYKEPRCLPLRPPRCGA